MLETENLVVGAGVFGASIALALDAAKRECILVDEATGILRGASANNQNRLHTGLHYPRDLETAIQSASGFKRFPTEYASAVNDAFPNFYFLGKQNSKTSLKGFEEFAKRIGVDLLAMTKEDFDKCGIDRSMVLSGWSVDERVIDIEVLRKLMLVRLAQSQIDLRLGTDIQSLIFRTDTGGWQALSNSGLKIEARNVFLCTYGSPIPSGNFELNLEPRTYQVTVVPIVKPHQAMFGATVMDGDFVTILPRGFSDEILLYGPEPSVAFTSESFEDARSYIKNKTDEINFARCEVLARTKSFFPNLTYIDQGESLVAVRSIPKNAESSDQRRSYIKLVGPNIFQIISGKVDHAPYIAEKILSIFSTGK